MESAVEIRNLYLTKVMSYLGILLLVDQVSDRGEGASGSLHVPHQGSQTVIILQDRSRFRMGETPANGPTSGRGRRSGGTLNLIGPRPLETREVRIREIFRNPEISLYRSLEARSNVLDLWLDGSGSFGRNRRHIIQDFLHGVEEGTLAPVAPTRSSGTSGVLALSTERGLEWHCS